MFKEYLSLRLDAQYMFSECNFKPFRILLCAPNAYIPISKRLWIILTFIFLYYISMLISFTKSI